MVDWIATTAAAVLLLAAALFGWALGDIIAGTLGAVLLGGGLFGWMAWTIKQNPPPGWRSRRPNGESG